MIKLEHVVAGYQGKAVLEDISLQIPKGCITSLIGPNGCGKTTLLRVATRQLTPQSGRVEIAGKAITEYGRKEFARMAALMPQVRNVPAITVQGLVMHGRFPHLGFSRKIRPEDRQMVEQAMEQTGVAQWRHRDLRELSGGERQRVYIAMAVAQDTPIIFLDEPTTYLDLGRQFELMELVQQLNKSGKTIVMVLHDLAQALQYSHRVALFSKGRLVEVESPDRLFAGGKIEDVFGVKANRDEWGEYYFTRLPQSIKKEG